MVSPRPRVGRSTRQGDIVRRAAQSGTSFESAQEIFSRLRAAGESIGLTTVYRHLQLLAETGEIDSLQTPSGEAVYRSCETTGHHHHLVCRSCGRSKEIESPDVERWAEALAYAEGFSEIGHTLEIFGLCSNCRNEAARA